MTTATLSNSQLISPLEFFERAKVNAAAKKAADDQGQLPKLVNRLFTSCAKSINTPTDAQINSLRWESYMSITPYGRTSQKVKGLSPDNQRQLYDLLNYKLLENGWCIVPVNGYERSKLIFLDPRNYFLIGPSPLQITSLSTVDAARWKFADKRSTESINRLFLDWTSQNRYPDIAEYAKQQLTEHPWKDQTAVIHEVSDGKYEMVRCIWTNVTEEKQIPIYAAFVPVNS